MRHPIQPLEKDDHGILRFKKNRIVRYLLEAGPFDMNDLARMDFNDEDHEQFAQLIGYSLGGFGELSFVSDETHALAEKQADEIMGTVPAEPPLEKTWGDAKRFCEKYGAEVKGNTDVFALAQALRRAVQDGRTQLAKGLYEAMEKLK